MEVNDTVPVIPPKERTNIEITTSVMEKNRFSFMEKHFFPGDTGPIKPNQCPGRRENDNYHLTREIMLREHGLPGGGRRLPSSSFQNRLHGSRYVVGKLKLLHSIDNVRKYESCRVLNFNRAGNILCSNSYQTESPTVKVWDWQLNKLKFSYEAGHTRGAQIIDLKFIETNVSQSIVTANHKGELHLGTISPSGGEMQIDMFYQGNNQPHKLAPCPHSPFVLTSAGRDGDIVICDLRAPLSAVCQRTIMGMEFYSISHHPFDPEICVSCSDNYVRVYDERNMSRAVRQMCPYGISVGVVPKLLDKIIA